LGLPSAFICITCSVHVEWVEVSTTTATVLGHDGLEDSSRHVHQHIGAGHGEVKGLSGSAEVCGLDLVVSHDDNNAVAIGLLAPCLTTLTVQSVSDDSDASASMLCTGRLDSVGDLLGFCTDKSLINALECVGAHGWAHG